MPIYADCLLQIAYFDERPVEENERCQVRLDEEEIVVTYRIGDRWISYVGVSVGSGHFELRCEETHGRATLHRSEAGGVLEGSWQEYRQPGGPMERGFWRIFLTE